MGVRVHDRYVRNTTDAIIIHRKIPTRSQPHPKGHGPNPGVRWYSGIYPAQTIPACAVACLHSVGIAAAAAYECEAADDASE